MTHPGSNQSVLNTENRKGGETDEKGIDEQLIDRLSCDHRFDGCLFRRRTCVEPLRLWRMQPRLHCLHRLRSNRVRTFLRRRRFRHSAEL